jgi:carbamoyl-phosphate synthase small subunit
MNKRVPAYLALEDGSYFEGTSFGANKDTEGEFVFNTSMTGYQEILTDPSYKGQVVVMTVSHVGNYGINLDDPESEKPQVEGFVVREACHQPSSWRSTQSLPDYLGKSGIAGIEGIDTRALVLLLREKGAMRGVISVGEKKKANLVERAKAVTPIEKRDLVAEVTCKKAYEWKQEAEPSMPSGPNGKEAQMRLDFKPEEPMPAGPFHVVLLDCGVKRNIMRCLANIGCKVTVVPAFTTAEEMLAMKPDGIMLSNGPGDPGRLPQISAAVRGIIGKVPVFGICLGHQMVGRALGAGTYKLKFGHHGGNQPVIHLPTGTVAITSQNHNFAVDDKTLPANAEVTHLNLNDRTVEGLKHKEAPLFTVQYHPEAAPGPHDAAPLFKQFVRMIASHKGVS